MFGCRARKATAVENTLGSVILIAAAAGVFVISYFEYGAGIAMNVFKKMDMNFALAPSAALLIFCAARYRSEIARIRNTPAAFALGDASYSIYLMQLGVLLAVVWPTGSTGRGLVFDSVQLVLVVAAIIALSMFVYPFYEAPARGWLRRLGARARAPHSRTGAEAPHSFAP